MPAVAAAIVGSAVIGAGASIYGSSKSSKAAGKAANQAAKIDERISAADRAQQWKMYQQTRKDNEQFYQRGRKDAVGGYDAAAKAVQPYTQYGAAATRRMADLAGVNGGGAQTTALASDPGYQFRMQQGITALDRSAAARGMLLSGAQTKALNDYGQGMASSELNNAYNRVAGVQNAAQSASGNLATIHQNRGGALSNLSQGQATQNQALATNTTNALSNIFQNSGNRQGQAVLGAGQARASAYQTGATGVANSVNAGVSNGLFAYGMQNGWFNGAGAAGGSTSVAAPQYVTGGAVPAYGG